MGRLTDFDSNDGKFTGNSMNTDVQSGYSTEISAYLPLVPGVKRVGRSFGAVTSVGSTSGNGTRG